MVFQCKDITGQKFGKLTAIKQKGSDKKRNKLWLCKCSCGKKTTVIANNLICGRSKSCGCGRGRSFKSIDLIEQKFGMLTIIRRWDVNKDKFDIDIKNSTIDITKKINIRLLCKCDCGVQIVIFKSNILTRKNLSCGCLVNKPKQTQLKKFLTEWEKQINKEKDSLIHPVNFIHEDHTKIVDNKVNINVTIDFNTTGKTI
jgi:hypothetical protein